MSVLLRNGLHLGALCSLAIAQPYFEPLADGPDFFVTHGATGVDVVLLAFGLVLVPPLFFLGCEALAGLAGDRPRDWLHLVFLGGLFALLVWQALSDASVASKVAYTLAGLVGAAGAAIYRLAEPVRTFVTVLAPVPLVVLVLFLGFSPVSSLAFGGGGDEPLEGTRATAPVVMLVLDELPTASLLDRRGRIDARRYPGFARLARASTWYPDAATVADYTQNAVPALLTGRRPEHGKLQVAAEYPRNLFTLLGGAWHTDALEAATWLCQAACPEQQRAPFARRMRSMVSDALRALPALPPGPRTRVADVVAPSGAAPPPAVPTQRSVRRHLPGLQPDRFARFLDTLGQRHVRPPFHFMHLELPHRPWHYLPSGQSYDSPRAVYARAFGRLPDDAWTVTVTWQRHLLQTQYTDRLLSGLVDTLEQTGLWDRALVVVTADHGNASLQGEEARVVSRANIGEVAPVPLFVKSPGQRRGRVDRAPAETIDVVPEVARLLGLRLPWKTDGRELTRVSGRRALSVMRQQDGRTVMVARGEVRRRLAAAVRRRLRVFPGGDPFALGPRPELRGRSVRGLRPLPATLDPPGPLRAVNPQARSLPVDVAGIVRGGSPRRRPLAVAMNGRVAATGFTTVKDGEESFTVLVPPEALRRGRNRVRVLALPAGSD